MFKKRGRLLKKNFWEKFGIWGRMCILANNSLTNKNKFMISKLNYLLAFSLSIIFIGCGMNEPNEISPTSKESHELEKFRIQIGNSYPEWNKDDTNRKKVSSLVEKDFIELIKSNKLDNSVFQLKDIKWYLSEDTVIIHFSHGNTSFFIEEDIHVDFFSIVPKNMVENLVKGSTYVFDITDVQRKLNYGENVDYSDKLIYSPYTKVSNKFDIENVIKRENVLDITLGMWLVDVKSIK